MEPGQGEDPWAPAGRWLQFLVVAAVALGFRNRLPFASPTDLVGTFQDDAFYFFAIARNVAHGHGFTFDGIHATNGFQPLWLFVLVPLFRIVSDDIVALRAIALVECAMVAGAAVLFFRLLARRLGPAVAFSATLVLVAQPGSPEALRSGMESSLFLLTLIGTWWLLTKMRFSLLGLLAALSFLTRIEAFVIAPLLVWHFRDRIREKPWTLAVLTLPSAATGAAYFLWNRLAFGGWLPVSGVVKRELVAKLSIEDRVNLLLDVPWFGEWAFARLFGSTYVFLLPLALRLAYVVLLCALGLLLWRFRAEVRRSLARIDGTFLLFAGLAIAALDLVALSWIQVWQRVPLLLVVTLLLVPLIHHSRAARRIVTLAALVCLVVPLGESQPRAGAAAECRLRAGEWLRRNTQPHERIGSWNAGLIGYVSHRPVVNLDGLVNNLEYFTEVIVGRRFEGYLRTEGISWLADTVPGPDPSARVFLARVGAEHLLERLETRAVLRDAHDPTGRIRAVIWSIALAPPPSSLRREAHVEAHPTSASRTNHRVQPTQR